MKKTKAALMVTGLLFLIVGILIVGSVANAMREPLSLFTDGVFTADFSPTYTVISPGETVTYSISVSNYNDYGIVDPIVYAWFIDGNLAKIGESYAQGMTELTFNVEGTYNIECQISFNYYPTMDSSTIYCYGTVVVASDPLVTPSPEPAQYHTTVQSNVGGTTNPTSGYYVTDNKLSITAYPSGDFQLTAWKITAGTAIWFEPAYNPITITYDGVSVQPIFESPTQPTPVPTPTTPSPTPYNPNPTPTQTPNQTPKPTSIIPLPPIPDNPTYRILLLVFGALLAVVGFSILWFSRRFF